MYQLKLSLQQAIITLRKNGWSHRAIARELEIDRGTVGKHLRLDSKSATEVPAGSDPAKPAISTPGSETDTSSNSAKVPTGSPAGERSHSARWREKIIAKLEAGLSAQRIYQDLVAEEQFAASYDSVKRFVRVLERGQPLPFRRMESEPGQEVQVDFGQGAWVMVEGKRKRELRLTDSLPARLS